MADQPDLFAPPKRKGMRSTVVDQVRRDFGAILSGMDDHDGMRAAAVITAHSMWAAHEAGDFRVVELLSAELRKWYAQADDLRRAQLAAAGGGSKLAQVLALAAPEP